MAGQVAGDVARGPQGLQAGARQMGLDISTDEAVMLSALIPLLTEWNGRLNLTSITDPVDIASKHILDSLAPAARGWSPLSGRRPASIVDVGSGAGFPALPLSILFPDIQVTAIEATGKKANFIEIVSTRLGLNLRAIKGRAETEGRLPIRRERFDLAVARAVAYLPVLAELCLPFVRVGGYFVAMKSESLEEEIDDGLYAVERLGGLMHEPVEYQVPGIHGARYMVVVEKVARTPPEFPRADGVPQNRPLVSL